MVVSLRQEISAARMVLLRCCAAEVQTNAAALVSVFARALCTRKPPALGSRPHSSNTIAESVHVVGSSCPSDPQCTTNNRPLPVERLHDLDLALTLFELVGTHHLEDAAAGGRAGASNTTQSERARTSEWCGKVSVAAGARRAAEAAAGGGQLAGSFLMATSRPLFFSLAW